MVLKNTKLNHYLHIIKYFYMMGINYEMKKDLGTFKSLEM